MIDDPIVIRKSRGLLVVSSSKSTDPIQLVRELSHDKLEVHLKNGSKYIEELHEGDDIQEIILEMMGYGILEAVITFCAWPNSQEGELEFYEDESDLKRLGSAIINMIYTPTPYLNSKFLSMELDDIDETANIKYYDGVYSRYIVTYGIRFRGRVDEVEDIREQFYDYLVPIARSLVAKTTSNTYDRAGINDVNVSMNIIEQ